MNAGVSTKDLPFLANVSDLLANSKDGTGLVALDVLAALLVADGPLSSAMSQLRDQITSGLIVRGQWADLMALSSTVDGAGAEVLITDTGTHNQATATGYDGASVANAGRYSLNLAWNCWVRIGDTGMASKADLVGGRFPPRNCRPRRTWSRVPFQRRNCRPKRTCKTASCLRRNCLRRRLTQLLKRSAPILPT